MMRELRIEFSTERCFEILKGEHYLTLRVKSKSKATRIPVTTPWKPVGLSDV
jgi:hypothetical protein